MLLRRSSGWRWAESQIPFTAHFGEQVCADVDAAERSISQVKRRSNMRMMNSSLSLSLRCESSMRCVLTWSFEVKRKLRVLTPRVVIAVVACSSFCNQSGSQVFPPTLPGDSAGWRWAESQIPFTAHFGEQVCADVDAAERSISQVKRRSNMRMMNSSLSLSLRCESSMRCVLTWSFEVKRKLRVLTPRVVIAVVACSSFCNQSGSQVF